MPTSNAPAWKKGIQRRPSHLLEKRKGGKKKKERATLGPSSCILLPAHRKKGKRKRKPTRWLSFITEKGGEEGKERKEREGKSNTTPVIFVADVIAARKKRKNRGRIATEIRLRLLRRKKKERKVACNRAGHFESLPDNRTGKERKGRKAGEDSSLSMTEFEKRGRKKKKKKEKKPRRGLIACLHNRNREKGKKGGRISASQVLHLEDQSREKKEEEEKRERAILLWQALTDESWPNQG